MNTVGIDDLKRRLSDLIRQVEAGARVVITRHNKPVVELTAAEGMGVHEGRRFGTGRLKPALKTGSGGAYLKVLEEDRNGRRE
ncbi:MAG: type II toxin-antitoxin system Phd/YefM family antitoxin [Acidobacteriota bacterium]